MSFLAAMLKTWMRGSSPRMTVEDSASQIVMAGHSRPKDGVLSHTYVPAIHAFSCCNAAKTWMPGTGPGMTNERQCIPTSWPGFPGHPRL